MGILKLKRKRKNFDVTVNSIAPFKEAMRNALTNPITKSATYSNANGKPMPSADHVRYDSASDTVKRETNCTNPFCPTHGIYPHLEAGKPFFIPAVKNVFGNNQAFMDALKSRLDEIRNTAGATPLVDDVVESPLDHAIELLAKVDELRETLNEVVTDLTADLNDSGSDNFMSASPDHVFDDMATSEDHSIVGEPLVYESNEDQSVHLAKVVFRGEPYTVIARVVDIPINDKYETVLSYVYLDDNMAFTAFTELFRARCHRRDGKM